MNKIKLIVLIGIIAFIGIIIIQVYWLRLAFDYEEKKLSQNIQVSLLEVVNDIDKYYGYQTPLINPVQKASDDYYVVNIHNDFDAGILEFYLTNTFVKKGITIDYEYAIYDCETDAMVYGSYVNMSKVNKQIASTYFPKANNLVYYFALRFPQKNHYIFSTLKLWVILSVIMIIVLIIYGYSIYIILQQKKYAELQKDFINNMTHEFKTPLASILIASNYMAKQPSIVADPKLEKYAHIVIEQSKKLDEHIEKILNLAKSDDAPLTLEKTAVNVVDILTKSIDIIKLKYHEASVKIESTSSDYTVLADEFHFSNIIYNFLDNAIKYCDKSPVVVISVEQLNNGLLLKFTDNGIGIPPKHLKHVFEKFYRVPNKKTSVNGFGLGLYYVQKICLLHHWKISIENNAGTGSVVKLIIKTP